MHFSPHSCIIVSWLHCAMKYSRNDIMALDRYNVILQYNISLLFMQATCCTKVLDKPLAPLHQYSQWVPSFKTPYSCKLHKQIVIDHGGGVSLDSQSKQLYMKSKPPGWILSQTLSQCFNRHLKQHFCHCVTSLLHWQRKRTSAVFWFFSPRLTAELPGALRLGAFHPSPTSGASSLLYQYAREICWKWKMK